MTYPPLISCIMPTANRPKFVEQAVACYLSQNYENTELIILDDGKEPLQGDLRIYVDYAEDINYVYAGPKRKSIGKKLNILCEMAHGDFIARFDDDDWSAPNRLSHQTLLISDKNQLIGFNSILFYRDEDNTLYRYYSAPNAIMGASFLFTKRLWEGIRFNELTITGSDNQFAESKARYFIKAVPGDEYLVAHIHPHGSNSRPVDTDPFYTKIALDKAPKKFLESLEIKV